LLIEEKLKSMNITLGEASKPVAAYVPGIITDNYIYVSGQLPIAEGKLQLKGHVGREVSEEDAYEAAKLCILNALSVLKDMLGDLDKVEQFVKLTGFVASAPGFTRQPKVVNGASEFIISLYGERGQHARSAVGVAELPLGAPVEIEMIVKIKA